MLYGELADFHGDLCTSQALKDVVAFLAGKAPTAEDGRHQLGDGIYVDIKHYTPKPAEERKYEAHVKYVDVQCVFEGEEVVYVRPLAGLEKNEDYPEKDLSYFKEPAKGIEYPVYLRPGMFVVLFPDDAHKTECRLTASEARKAIAKIPAELLKWR